MSRRQLTPVSYLVLGLVEKCRGATAYDLKQEVARSIGYFWSFSHSQIYAEAADLAAAGLLDEEQETGGRRRRVYTLTREGRGALHAWLREPVDVQPEIRDLGLLKLFFGDLVDREDVAALARAQEAGHRARLERYREIEAGLPEEARGTPAASTLVMGLLVERAFVRFWRDVAEAAATSPGGAARPAASA